MHRAAPGRGVEQRVECAIRQACCDASPNDGAGAGGSSNNYSNDDDGDNNNNNNGDGVVLHANAPSLNCPITLKPLQTPVRSRRCGHVFEKHAVEQLMRNTPNGLKCPVVGCSQLLQRTDLVRDRGVERRLRIAAARLPLDTA